MSKSPEGCGPMAGRLAMRVEGDFWVAYYAMPHTMEGAIRLGSIRMSAVTGNDVRRQAALNLMRDVMGDAIQDAVGATPVWGEPEPAPESERSGSA